jgi:S-disulfanyl-L-cysteine oxidoreductase SoxD
MRAKCLIALIAVVGLAGAQNVWTGVYTADQAKRGLETYKQQCGMCHGETMSGGGGVPAVAGPEFLYSWNGKNAGELFDYLKAMMPPSDPGSLSDQKYADVMAAMFQTDGFPAGQAELKPDSKALADIAITKDKP